MKFRKTRAEVIEGTIERLEKKLERQEQERVFMGVAIRHTEVELERWRVHLWQGVNDEADAVPAVGAAEQSLPRSQRGGGRG